MLYDSLKILHIISAAMLVTSIFYSYWLWKRLYYRTQTVVTQRIQNQTLMVIIPFAVIQITTGFTMISLKHYNPSQLWIIGSLIGFVTLIGSWLSFIYFLLLSQQLTTETSITSAVEEKQKLFRRTQQIMLFLCMAALLTMIFLMANKIL